MNTMLRSLLAGIGLSLAGAVAAGPITITPGENPAGTPCTANTCWTANPGDIDQEGDGPDNGAGQPSLEGFAELVGLTEADVEFLYKSDQGSVDDPDLPFADSYSTVYGNEPTDPSEATISWDGSDYINCGVCYLWVKDGNMKPYVYVFDIGWWDGQTALFLDNFWPQQGAISNVGIFGRVGDTTQVPVPGTLGLLGLGLVGIAMTRRRKAKV